MAWVELMAKIVLLALVLCRCYVADTISFRIMQGFLLFLVSIPNGVRQNGKRKLHGEGPVHACHHMACTESCKQV